MRIELRTPDGRNFQTDVNSVEFIDGRDCHGIALLISAQISPSDIPPETEIWVES